MARLSCLCPRGQAWCGEGQGGALNWIVGGDASQGSAWVVRADWEVNQ